MGQPAERPAPPEPPKTQMEIMIDLKMKSKMLKAQAKRALKQADKFQMMARKALKNNQEETAKMYLQNESSHRQMHTMLQRTGTRLELMMNQAKNIQMSQMLSDSFRSLSDMTNTMSVAPLDNIVQSLQKFQDTMTRIEVDMKVMDQTIGQKDSINFDIEDKLDRMKREQAMRMGGLLLDSDPLEKQKEQLAKKLSGI